MDTTEPSHQSEMPSGRTSSLTSCARSGTSTFTPSAAVRRFPLDLVESLRASRDRAHAGVYGLPSWMVHTAVSTQVSGVWERWRAAGSPQELTFTDMNEVKIIMAGNHREFLDYVRDHHLDLRHCVPICEASALWKLRGHRYTQDALVAIGSFWRNPDANEIWEYCISTSWEPDYYQRLELGGGVMQRTVFDFDEWVGDTWRDDGWELEESWSPDVGEGMLIEDLLDESTLQWLERVKERKAGNVKADQISDRQEEGHTPQRAGDAGG